MRGESVEKTHVIRRNGEANTLMWLDHYGYVGAIVPILPTLPALSTFGTANILIFAEPGGPPLLAMVGNTLVWDEGMERVGVVVEPTRKDLNTRIGEGILQAEHGRTYDLGSFKEFLVNEGHLPSEER
jgi:hypothetical protein